MMLRWGTTTVVVLIFMWHCGVCVDAQTVKVTPVPQALPCPDERLTYECHAMEGVTLSWVLPNSATLRFTSTDDINSTESSGISTATLTGILQSVIDGVMVYSYNSTLWIEQPPTSWNNSELICRLAAVGRTVENSTNITLSGFPDSPLGLHHNASLNTESSAVIQWRAPLVTEGDEISVISFIVHVDGRTISVNNSGSEMFTHNITLLQYNTDYNVTVTTNNSCGRESDPVSVSVRIDARVPPEPMNLTLELHCDVPLKNGRPVVINWMNGAAEEGELYPGEITASANFDPEDDITNVVDITCSLTNCTAIIDRDDNFTVSVSLTNDAGTSMSPERKFDSTPLIVKNNSESSRLIVNVTVRTICRSANYTLVLFIGVMQSNVCDLQRNVTADIVPGGHHIFEENIEPAGVCYLPSLDGDAGVLGEVPGGGGGGSTGLHPGIIVAIALLAVLVILTIIVIILLSIYLRHKYKKARRSKEQEMKPLSSSSGSVSPKIKESSVSPADTTPFAKTSTPPPPTEPSDQGPMYQDPSTITHTPHPETGEIYTDVKPDKKKKKKEQKTSEEAGPVYQAPGTIEHQEAPGGDVYAVSQKKAKKAKKKEKEETALLYSKPDREGQKAKSQGLTYAQPDVGPSSKPPPPSEGSTYADLRSPPSDDA